MLNKLAYSKKFAELLSLNVDDIMTTWWGNLRDHGGLRLTQQGYEILSQDLELESYRFTVPALTMTPKNLLVLDKKLTCPYYLARQKTTVDIVLFGGDHAIMATLYGDIEQWLKSLEKT